MQRSAGPAVPGPSVRRLAVAVTGGIGAGKSTVSRRLGRCGAVVIDSDQLAREVVAPGTPGLAAVAAAFGSGMVSSDGTLDRAALAAIVFADPAARLRLNALTHPLVRDRFATLREQAPAGAVVVNDIPLLVDLATAASFHLTIGVGAPQPLRIDRLVRRGLDEADAQARIDAQIVDDERRALCDVWLDNGGTEVELAGQVDELWAERIEPYRRNLVAGRPAVTAAVRKAPDDAAVERERARVDHAAKAAGVTLDGLDTERREATLNLRLTVKAMAWARLEPALMGAGFAVSGSHPLVLTSGDPGSSLNLYVTVS